MRSKSILQDDKQCFVTGRTDNLQCHHIFYGRKNRQISDKNGFWVWLTGEYHNQNSRIDAHHNIELDLELKRLCQLKYQENHYTYEFMKLIGRSYL